MNLLSRREQDAVDLEEASTQQLLGELYNMEVSSCYGYPKPPGSHMEKQSQTELTGAFSSVHGWYMRIKTHTMLHGILKELLGRK